MGSNANRKSRQEKETNNKTKYGLERNVHEA
jgi:hypothetical protein